MLHFYLGHRIDGEKIILSLRRHWFVMLIKIIVWVVAAAMPALLYYIMSDLIADLGYSQIIYPILTLFASLLYLYLWMFLLYIFLDYYLDNWIITSERIINIDQNGLFNRIVSEQKLYRIQDVTSEIKGFFSTFLNYGTIYIQTAGEKERFIFKQVPNPQGVAKKLLRIIEQNKKFHQMIDADGKIHTNL